MLNRMKILCCFFCCVVVISSFAADLHDPTRPAGVSVASEILPSGVTVHSIIISQHHKVAVIGNRHVTIGDKINGAEVVDIQPYAVYLKNKSGVFSLPLLSNKIKHPSQSEGE